MAKEPDEKNIQVPPPVLRFNGQTVIMWAAVAGLLGLIIGGCIGFGFGHHIGAKNTQTATNRLYPRSGRGGMGMSGMWQQMGSGSRLEGVVTQVNGSSFTLAGQGKTETITTNSSTTYSGGAKSVAVNDTVMLTYTQDGSTYVAQEIMIMNGGMMNGANSSM